MESLMKIMKILTPLVILLALTACGSGQTDQSAVETQVAALLSQQATAGSSGGAPQPTVGGAPVVQGEQPTVDPLLVIPDDASCTPDTARA
jgi:hypothetical protein